MSERQHPIDALHEAVDGRLDPDAAAALDLHLAACPACRRELDLLRWTKSAAASGRTPDDVPADFGDVLGRLLDDADANTGAAVEPGDTTSRRRVLLWWATAAAAALAGLVTWRFVQPRRQDIVSEVAVTFRGYRTGTVELAVRSTDVADVERYFRNVGVPFETRVFDLGMMAFEVQGGLVTSVANRTSALFVYRGATGDTIVCQMYPGRTAELGEPSRRLVHDDIDFLVFDHGDLTLVFWQEGEIICVLTGAGAPDTVINLAFAKAVKA